MKKLFVLLGVFCALCFVACSNFQLAGGDMGVVSLSIGDNLAREIRSAAASRNVADGTYTLTASIRGEYSDSQTVAVANGNYSGVTFTFEDVPVGKRIILDLTAKTGNNYIWYGNSGKHMVVSGINNLNVAVGRVSGVLLWKEALSAKIAPYGNLDAATEDFTLGKPSVWCFDNRGYIYLYRDGTGGVQYFVLNADGTYSPSKPYVGDSTAPTPIAYDNVTNILYGLTETKIFEYEKDKTPKTVINSLANDGVQNSVGFAVHDGIAYVASFSQIEQEFNEIMGGVAKITVFKYDVKNPSRPSKEEITLPAVFISQDGRAPTGQMIYHEGFLYLLLSSFTVSPSVNQNIEKVYSCGALVKINPSTLAIDTSFGDNGYLGLVSGRTISGTYNNDSYSMKLYSPTESDESRAFYGPVGFVAVMPKKLVIADAGYALSKGSNNELRARRKNRVVTVDLETQAFDVASLSDTTFYGNITSGCGFLVVE